MRNFLITLLIIVLTNKLFPQSSFDSIAYFVEESASVDTVVNRLLKKSVRFFQNDSIERMFDINRTIDSLLVENSYSVSPGFLFSYAQFNESIPDFEKSILIYEKAANRALEISDYENYILSNNRKGYIYSIRGDNINSVKTIHSSLMFVNDQKLTDLKESVLVYAAFIYRNAQDTAMAQDFFTQALSYGDSTNPASYYHVALHELGNFYSAEGNFKKGLNYQISALKIREKYNLESYIDYSYHDIALTYSMMGSFRKAVEFIQKSITLSKQKKETWSLAVSYLSIAEILFQNGANPTGILYLDSARHFAEKNELKDILYRIHYAYYRFYFLENNYERALEHYIISDTYKDSVANESIQKQINLLNAQFQSERKDKEIVSNQLTIKRQKLLIYSFVTGSIIILGFLVWLFFLYRKLKLYNKQLNEKNVLIELQKEQLSKKSEELQKQTKILREINTVLVERSARINQQKDEIEAQRDEIEAQRDLVVEQKNQLEKFNQHLTDSIHYAESIQKSMLPSDNQFKQLFSDSFVFFKPLDIVSGDFYWLIRNDESIYLALADCTGHGVSGAFMSLLGISFLNEIILMKGVKETNFILDELRSNIIDALKQDLRSGVRRDGMDIALCKIDRNLNRLSFSGANSSCIIVQESKKVTILKGDKNPVSIHFQMQSFTSKTVKFDSNNQLYLYTDGFYDQFGGENRKKFQKRRMIELIVSNSYLPMSEQLILLSSSFLEWKGANPQVDDTTVVGVKS